MGTGVEVGTDAAAGAGTCLTAEVAATLGAAAEAFGTTPLPEPAPRWGELYARLEAGGESGSVVSLGGTDSGRTTGAGHAAAIELIYEGYLLHYREPRAVELEGDDQAARLLAGDFFYARGLRSIAALGDIDAVGLLARLMASCSYLRTVEAPFDADDALWAYTMGGLVAQHAGAPASTCTAFFDEFDAGLGESLPDVRVRAAAVRAAHALGLAAPGPLLQELERGEAAPASDTGTGR